MKVVNSGHDSVELSNINRTKSNQRVDGKDRTDKSASTSDATSASGKIEISDNAKLLAKGVEAAKNVDLTDKEKIAMIKERIRNDEYKPDFGKVAEKLIDEHIVNS